MMGTTVITGGAGFLGRKLAERIAADPAGDDLIIVDQSKVLAEAAGSPLLPSPLPGRSIDHVPGDITDPALVTDVITDRVSTVYHLASVVSAGAEQDFDLGYAVNLQATIMLLERCRAVGQETGRSIQVVFTSSCAAYGSGAGREVGDATSLRPETSYGVQKATGELLINDYHRKGFVDGRTLRLPTVSVRPGKPNLAASGFASGIIREPLNGIDVVCPVSADTVVAVISPDRVVDALAGITAVGSEELGADRTVLLPGLPMSMTDAVATVEAEGAAVAPQTGLGTVTFEPDDQIQRIVDSWPSTIGSARTAELGFVGDSSVAAIVRQHIRNEMEG